MGQSSSRARRESRSERRSLSRFSRRSSAPTTPHGGITVTADPNEVGGRHSQGNYFNPNYNQQYAAAVPASNPYYATHPPQQLPYGGQVVQQSLVVPQTYAMNPHASQPYPMNPGYAPQQNYRHQHQQPPMQLHIPQQGISARSVGSDLKPPTAESEVTECPICFENLCEKPAVFFVNTENGQRTRCPHYFHDSCAQDLSRHQRACPLCRAPFSRIERLPADPAQWFNAVDVDGNGSLTSEELLAALMATMNFDWKDLEKKVNEKWNTWDSNQSGSIDRQEFLSNVLPWLKKHIKSRTRMEQAKGPIPSISQHPLAWFQYWDEDQSGELDVEEVVRAFCKTFKFASMQQVDPVRQLVHALWSEFDHDGSGGIDFREFNKPEGLKETVLANMG